MTLGIEDSLALATPDTDDHFAVRHGVKCAGVHLLIDMWGIRGDLLDDPVFIENTLKTAAEAAGATVIFDNFHQFNPTGVTGVVGLSESHISIHTWPDAGLALLDILLCGKTEPDNCMPILRQAFNPEGSDVQETLRGRLDRQQMRLKARGFKKVW